MSRSKWVILALVAVLVVGVIVALSSGGPAPGLVTPDDFAKLQKRGVRIVDVRTEAEYAGGHIPGAENVPLSSFATTSAAWDPAEPVALYCATGSRSAEAMQMLTAQGFETVYDLSGGIIAWSGPLSGGAEEGVAEAPQQTPTGQPVMYEFYTDW